MSPRRPVHAPPSDDWVDHPAPHQQEALDAIRDRYRAAHADADGGDGRPPQVPHPSAFQADPLVSGGGPDRGRLAREAKRLLDLDPETKSRVDRITLGPTQGSINWMAAAGLPLDTYGQNDREGQSDLSGVASRDLGYRGISPTRRAIGLQDQDLAHGDLGKQGLLQTLTHEIGHAAGMDEPDAVAVGEESLPIREAETPALRLRAALTRVAAAEEAQRRRTEPRPPTEGPPQVSTRGERILRYFAPSYPLAPDDPRPKAPR